MLAFPRRIGTVIGARGGWMLFYRVFVCLGLVRFVFFIFLPYRLLLREFFFFTVSIRFQDIDIDSPFRTGTPFV